MPSDPKTTTAGRDRTHYAVDIPTMIEACTAFVAAEQEAWVMPAVEWTEQTFRDHGIWGPMEKAILAAAAWNDWKLA